MTNAIAQRSARPFLPSDLKSSGRSAPRDHLVRLATAKIRSAATKTSVEEIIAKEWPGDEVSALLTTKATVAPASTATSGWAQELAQSSVQDFLANLGPMSAASALIRASMQVSLDERSSVVVPGVSAAPGNAGFVEEGAPIAVRALTVGGLTISPKKIASITTWSWELARRSQIEGIVRQVMIESAGLALDSALLGTAAASASAPAGVRNGISALTATSGGGDDAMVADLAALAAAVAPVAGGSIVFVAAPGEAVKIALRSRSVPYPVLPSAALAAGVVMAVATNALVVAVDPVPDLETSTEATLHMETSPAALVAGGTPATGAVRSLFQTGTIGLRTILGASFGLRSAGAVAWVSGTTW